MYLTIVNVHGATTSLCGSHKWYSEHAAEPFDVVIIDEISKATAPEIILAAYLERKSSGLVIIANFPRME